MAEHTKQGVYLFRVYGLLLVVGMLRNRVFVQIKGLLIECGFAVCYTITRNPED